MMINSNYAQQITQAKSNNALVVNFDNTTPAVQPIPGEKDTVTLSDKALAMMNGNEVKEIAPTYVRPETARSLLPKSEVAQSEASNTTKYGATNKKIVIDNRFTEIMQNILDQR